MAARLSLDLPRDTTAPALARDGVRDRLAGAVSEGELADVRLLVSELVTNALRHGDGQIRLEVSVTDTAIRAEVRDQGHGFRPAVREPGADQVGGWGLWLVAETADRWGVYEGSTHVWFEMQRGG